MKSLKPEIRRCGNVWYIPRYHMDYTYAWFILRCVWLIYELEDKFIKERPLIEQRILENKSTNPVA